MHRWKSPPYQYDSDVHRWKGPPYQYDGDVHRWKGPPYQYDSDVHRWKGPPYQYDSDRWKGLAVSIRRRHAPVHGVIELFFQAKIFRFY